MAREITTRGFVDPLVPIRPPRLSLRRSSTNDPNAATDQRWVEGFAFTPNGCADGGIVSAQCPPEPETKIEEDLPAIVTYIPFAVYASARCSTMGGPVSMDYLMARAAQVLDAVTDKQLESEFWTGAYAQANNLPNDYLANSATMENLTPNADIIGGAYALAALQMYLADCHDGGQGMIHATRATITMWFAQNAGLYRAGDLILDAFDNIIVPGVGYDGSGPTGPEPDADTAWAYATSLVEVKIGAVDPIPASVAQAVNRSTNDATFRAEKPVAAFWDGCCHAGVRVNVCAPVCVATT